MSSHITVSREVCCELDEIMSSHITVSREVCYLLCCSRDECFSEHSAGPCKRHAWRTLWRCSRLPHLRRQLLLLLQDQKGGHAELLSPQQLHTFLQASAINIIPGSWTSCGAGGAAGLTISYLAREFTILCC